jgi:hypothetical protein
VDEGASDHVLERIEAAAAVVRDRITRTHGRDHPRNRSRWLAARIDARGDRLSRDPRVSAVDG